MCHELPSFRKTNEVSVVFLILTGLNLADAIATARRSESPVWVNADLVGPAEAAQLRADGLNLTTISHWIDPMDRADVDDMLATMREHHPGHMLAVEWPVSGGESPL